MGPRSLQNGLNEHNEPTGGILTGATKLHGSATGSPDPEKGGLSKYLDPAERVGEGGYILQVKPQLDGGLGSVLPSRDVPVVHEANRWVVDDRQPERSPNEMIKISCLQTVKYDR